MKKLKIYQVNFLLLSSESNVYSILSCSIYDRVGIDMYIYKSIKEDGCYMLSYDDFDRINYLIDINFDGIYLTPYPVIITEIKSKIIKKIRANKITKLLE